MFYEMAVLTAVILMIASCTTIPKDTAVLDTSEFSLLPAGGAMYLWADVQQAKPLLESISFDGLDLKQTGAVLDRTATAAAVFSGAKTDKFFALLRGKYPVFQAGFSMTFSKDWKKEKSTAGGSYWKSDRFGIGLALDSARALVSPGDPFERLANSTDAVTVPQDFDGFKKGSVMAGWIAAPQETVNKFLADFGIPIQLPAQDFFFRVLKGGEDSKDLWELEFYIRTPSAGQARALAALLTLARIFIVNIQPAGGAAGTGSGGAAAAGPGAAAGPDKQKGIMDFLPALFMNQPQLNDAVLTQKSDTFTSADLSLLFNAISVYSD